MLLWVARLFGRLDGCERTKRSGDDEFRATNIDSQERAAGFGEIIPEDSGLVASKSACGSFLLLMMPSDVLSSAAEIVLCP